MKPKLMPNWKRKAPIILLLVIGLATVIYVLGNILARYVTLTETQQTAALPLNAAEDIPVDSSENLLVLERAVEDDTSSLAASARLQLDQFEQFEDSIFTYINDELDKILAIDKNITSSANIVANLNDIGKEAINRLRTFERQNTLSPQQQRRLSEIDLYINLQVFRDRNRTEELIIKMDNDYKKLSMIMSYLQAFAQTEDHALLREFALTENTWATQLEGNYISQVENNLFKANPIGNSFPNYLKDYKSRDNVSLDLTRFKGKVVLVDFWASWCIPCIQEIPYHRAAYYKYHAQGFDIIYINLDLTNTAALDIIAEYELTWHHLMSEGGLAGEVAQKYGVERLPTAYLIDTEGNVLAVDVKGNELEQQLMKLFSS